MPVKYRTLLLTAFLAAIYCTPLLAYTTKVPNAHPEYANIDGKPMCTDCHKEGGDIVFSRFNHTTYFTENHRLTARQGSDFCYMCHTQRSCNDCHATGSELTPTRRDQNNIHRRNHHRGDYLNKHKIDGHVSPLSCYRCHGNPKTSKSCVQCHG